MTEPSPFEVIAKRVTPPPTMEPSDRSRRRYKQLAAWLGVTGAHNFYARRWWQGAAELAIVLVSGAGLSAIMFFQWGAGAEWPFFIAPLCLAGLVGTGLTALVENISVERDGRSRLFLP